MASAEVVQADAAHTRQLSSGDQAALFIRRLIFDGELRPGQRVPQDHIAAQLGISRIPVREALIALEREGWVSTVLHRGAFVNALDHDAVRDHYALYGLICSFAIQRAMHRGDADELAETLGAIAEQLECCRGATRFTQLTIDFHRTVAEASRSQRIKVLLRAMTGLIPGDFFSFVPAAIDDERAALRAIAEAVADPDADAAAAGYVHMMTRVGEQVIEVLEARHLFDGPDLPATQKPVGTGRVDD